MSKAKPQKSIVRALREQRGLTQFDLAAKSGLSLQTVSLAERAGVVTDRTAHALAAVLEVEAERLRP